GRRACVERERWPRPLAPRYGGHGETMPELAPINFTRGIPATESFPTDEVVAAAAAVLKDHAATVLQYGPSAGFAPLREWIAQWQGVEPAQVMLANGSLQLVEFLCFAALAPGDVV